MGAYLEAENLGLDELQRAAVDLDETLAGLEYCQFLRLAIDCPNAMSCRPSMSQSAVKNFHSISAPQCMVHLFLIETIHSYCVLRKLQDFGTS